MRKLSLIPLLLIMAVACFAQPGTIVSNGEGVVTALGQDIPAQGKDCAVGEMELYDGSGKPLACAKPGVVTMLGQDSPVQDNDAPKSQSWEMKDGFIVKGNTLVPNADGSTVTNGPADSVVTPSKPDAAEHNAGKICDGSETLPAGQFCMCHGDDPCYIVGVEHPTNCKSTHIDADNSVVVTCECNHCGELNAGDSGEPYNCELRDNPTSRSHASIHCGPEVVTPPVDEDGPRELKGDPNRRKL